jgi:hypothetical protein
MLHLIRERSPFYLSPRFHVGFWLWPLRGDLSGSQSHRLERESEMRCVVCDGIGKNVWLRWVKTDKYLIIRILTTYIGNPQPK